MRVNDRNDRGAVALMVSVALIAIFGFTALTIDLGNAWQNRRQLVTATDSAALAAAQEYALHGNGCMSVAPGYIADNKADATMTACTPDTGAETGSSFGHVLVTAETTIDYAFAPIIGVDSKTLSSTTVARYGIPLSAGGLRPFGLCWEALQAMPAFAAWNPADGPSTPIEIRYDKAGQPSACILRSRR